MKISFKRLVLVAGVTGVAFFLVTIIFLTFYLPGHTYNYYTEVISHIDKKIISHIAGLPVRLQIPEINVDAVIEHLGLTPQGAMDVPKGPADVAWYNLGPYPGNVGSAVIAGHYGTWKNGQGSVFDDLNKLKSGDKIYVEDENGATTTFVVRESRSYEPSADASSVFNSSDGKAHLNIITCEGAWLVDQKTYSNRLVIFADKE